MTFDFEVRLCIVLIQLCKIKFLQQFFPDNEDSIIKVSNIPLCGWNFFKLKLLHLKLIVNVSSRNKESNTLNKFIMDFVSEIFSLYIDGYPGRPTHSNNGSNSNCVKMSFYNSQWAVTPCTSSHRYLCEASL